MNNFDWWRNISNMFYVYYYIFLPSVSVVIVGRSLVFVSYTGLLFIGWCYSFNTLSLSISELILSRSVANRIWITKVSWWGTSWKWYRWSCSTSGNIWIYIRIVKFSNSTFLHLLDSCLRPFLKSWLHNRIIVVYYAIEYRVHCLDDLSQ